ncbi:DUF503 domain-containing protein [Hippea alviniae]|uniref:DUF503 domain-containing protein n=1 Tax=Hippea alviniae TaxID=1279027 RepID=UPI00068885A3|nr:DUF503 domain-containing protein [Hippea alviniae]
MEIDFRINDSFSLKDKRRVLKSIIEKSRRLFNISMAETDNNEMHNFATVGLSIVSRDDGRFIESVFDKILDFIENNFDVEIVDVRRDFL